jgi:zinc protease
MSGQASRLGTAEVVVGDLEFGRTYFEQLARVKARGPLKALRAHLVPGRLTSVSLEPEGCKSSAGPAGGSGRAARLRGGPASERRAHRLSAGPAPSEPAPEPPHPRGAVERGAGQAGQLDAPGHAPDEGHAAAQRRRGRPEDRGGRRVVHVLFGRQHARARRRGAAGGRRPRPRPDRGGRAGPGVQGGNPRDGARAPSSPMLREEKDDVVSCARRMLRARFFGSDPFALSALGDEGGVSATGSRDVAALWKGSSSDPGSSFRSRATSRPRGCSRASRSSCSGSPGARPSRRRPALRGPAEAGEFVERQPREQAVVMEGFPGAVLDAPDYYAGEVRRALQRHGVPALRARARAEGPGLFRPLGRIASRSAAVFYFIAGTQPGKENEVLDEIGAEIARVQAGESRAGRAPPVPGPPQGGTPEGPADEFREGHAGRARRPPGQGAQPLEVRLAGGRRDDRGPRRVRPDAPRALAPDPARRQALGATGARRRRRST